MTEIEGLTLKLSCACGIWTRFGDQDFDRWTDILFPKLERSNAGKYTCTVNLRLSQDAFRSPNQTVQINVLCKYFDNKYIVHLKVNILFQISP